MIRLRAAALALPAVVAVKFVASGSTGWGNPDVHAWEPSDEKYWGRGSQKAPFDVADFEASALSQEVFEQYAREGRPIVVRGVLRRPEWTCPHWAKSAVTSTVTVGSSRGTLQQMLRAMEESKMAEWRSEPREKQCKLWEKPIEVGLRPEWELPPEDPARTMMADFNDAATFLDRRNFEVMIKHPDFWFSSDVCNAVRTARVDSSGMAVQGASEQDEEFRSYTMSLQLSGSSVYKLGPIAHRARPHVVKLYRKGKVNDREERNRWNIFKDVTLEQGDVIFWPVGFIHEQRPTSPCSVEFTADLLHPAPAVFWRNFLPRLRWTADVFDLSWPLRVFIKVGKPMLDAKSFNESDILAFFDTDGDGKASSEERSRVLAVWMKLEEAIDDLPDDIRSSKYMFEEILEHEEEVKLLDPDVREAIFEYERKALKRDEEWWETQQQGKTEL